MLTTRLASSLLALSLAACGVSTNDTTVIADSSLVVDNRSDFAITELYLTGVGNSSWGANLLRGDVLLPDETLTLGVTCGTYDALLVDEDNVTCELNNLDLCLNDAVWVIRNNTCAVFGAAARAKAESQAKTDAATPATAARP